MEDYLIEKLYDDNDLYIYEHNPSTRTGSQGVHVITYNRHFKLVTSKQHRANSSIQIDKFGQKDDFKRYFDTLFKRKLIKVIIRKNGKDVEVVNLDHKWTSRFV